MSKQCVTHHFACDCREAMFKELERENAALREQVEELDAKWKMAEDQCFDQVGKIGELERENAALRADRVRLDFLGTLTGSGWASLHLDRKGLNDDWLLTRNQIDRRMATEVKT